MKIARSALVALCEKHDIKTSKKGKPVSNEALLKIVEDNIDSMMGEDGTTDDTVVATLSTAFDEEDEVTVTGDDPTVPKKAKKPEKAEKAEKKGKKPAKEEESDDEDEEEEEKPAKKSKKDAKADKKADKKVKKAEKKEKREAVERDAFNSNPESSAGRVNAVLLGLGKKDKGLTLDQIMEALDDETITRSRVRDHLRRLHLVDELIEKDAKDRYKPSGKKVE